MEPEEIAKEEWTKAVEAVITGVASPDAINDNQIFDFKTMRPFGGRINVHRDLVNPPNIQMEIPPYDFEAVFQAEDRPRRTVPATGIPFAELYGGSPRGIVIDESSRIQNAEEWRRRLNALYSRIVNPDAEMSLHTMSYGVAHRNNTMEGGVFDSKMRDRMHWFGSCQVAKYRIACTRADRYFDAGFISKRHMERLIQRGRDLYYGNPTLNNGNSENNERYSAHFRQLVQALYNNHCPNMLNSAVLSCHWNLPRGEHCPIPIDEYYAITYSSFWNEEIVWHKKWRNETIVSIAQGIFINKAWDRMPILADALEDAGCDNQPVLHRLRTEELIFPAMKLKVDGENRMVRSPIRARGPHHRGCYILHKILGGRYNSRRIP